MNTLFIKFFLKLLFVSGTSREASTENPSENLIRELSENLTIFPAPLERDIVLFAKLLFECPRVFCICVIC